MKFSDWHEYQKEVAAFFRRQGCRAEVEKKLCGARAQHEIDVYVTFQRSGIECSWIVECKLWKSRVPKEKVMALKAIVDDLGADRGLIVSEAGFQSGALDAVRDTNITLVTSLEEFEKTASTISTEQQLIYTNSEDGAPIYKFPDGSQPHHVLRYDNLLISANWGNGTISIIDLQRRAISRTIDLDKYESKSPVTGERVIRKYPPGNMAIAEGKLFLGQVFSEFLLVIDIETHSVVKRIYLPGGGEGQVAVSPDQKYVYFASNKENQFYIIDSATYEYQTVPYPSGGRGCMSLTAHPNDGVLFIGIQRSGNLNGKSYYGGNCFIAAYDLQKQGYLGTVYLAEVTDGRSDDATPACIEVDSVDKKIYVGMFQSMRGICVINADTYELEEDIRFLPNDLNPHFGWVDPLSVKLYGRYLLSLNRKNCELVVLDKNTQKQLNVIFLGDAPNGPRAVEIVGSEVVISYPERNGLIILDTERDIIVDKSIQPSDGLSDN